MKKRKRKRMIKRFIQAILYYVVFCLFPLMIFEFIFYVVRYILTGKEFGNPPLIFKIFIEIDYLLDVHF